MKNSTRYVLIAICIIMILLAAGGVVWAFANKFSDKAYAEANEVLMFNQQVLDTYTHEYTLSRQLNTIITQQVLKGNHKYYIRINIDFTQTSNSGGLVACDMQRTNSHTTLQQIHLFNTTEYTYDNIFELNNSYTDMYINLYSTSNDNLVVNALCIDLTMMYGEDAEPDLAYCQEYFNRDYYPYNSGTPMIQSQEYLNGYRDGANDIYESMTITYNSFTIGSSSSTYANNTVDRGELIFDSQYGAYMFSGVIGINLFGIVDRGTNFSIDFELYIPDLQGETNIPQEALTFTLTFAYVDENNNLVNIATIIPTYIGSLTNKYVGDFVLPISTSTIYAYVDYNIVGDNSAPTQVFAFTSSMTFKSTDMGLLMTNAYQRGASSIQQKYDPNGEEYAAIYGLGYQNGLAAQNATLGTMEYIGAAFTGLGTILQIELLPGVPFSLFILLPLMFGLITFVIKLSKGGS